MPSYALAFPISFYSQKSILVAPTADPSSGGKKLLRALPKRQASKKVMLIKMKFWLIFKILFSDRDNAIYNLKASQKHVFICAIISNKFLFAKIDFGSTNIRSIFNCKNAQNPHLTAKSKKTLC